MMSHITPREVEQTIKLFQNNHFYKNEIQPKLWMLVSDVICLILSNIFNNCVEKGVYPSVFKVARVIPIFKYGTINDFNNYRPIANLPFFCQKIRQNYIF